MAFPSSRISGWTNNRYRKEDRTEAEAQQAAASPGAVKQVDRRVHRHPGDSRACASYASGALPTCDGDGCRARHDHRGRRLLPRDACSCRDNTGGTRLVPAPPSGQKQEKQKMLPRGREPNGVSA
jgi:hypothetical protein